MNKQVITLPVDKLDPKGIVGRRLIDTRKFFEQSQKFGVEFQLSFDEMLKKHKSSTFRVIAVKVSKKLGNDLTSMLIDNSAKSQFEDNKIWKFIQKQFNKDIQIPFITGHFTRNIVWKPNIVVNGGHARYSGQFGGVTSTPMSALAIGTSSTAPVATDTTLGAEITTSGGSRGAATVSQVTTSVTNDTIQFSKTWTLTGTLTIQEEGIFDNNVSGGTMGSHNTFSSVTGNNGDSFQIIHKIQS